MLTHIPGRAAADVGMLTVLRNVYSVSLDVNGNFSVQYNVRAVEFQTRYVTYGGIYLESRVRKMTATYYPSTACRNVNLTSAVIMAAPFHADYASAVGISDGLENANGLKFHAFASDKPFKVTWKADMSDAEENEYRAANGTSVQPVMPASLGGVAFWSDGPVAQVGLFIGNVIVEWTVEYRGIR